MWPQGRIGPKFDSNAKKVCLIDFEANRLFNATYQNDNMGNRQCSNGPILGLGNKVEWSEKTQQIALNCKKASI